MWKGNRGQRTYQETTTREPDSMLLVRQLQGKFKVNAPHLRPLHRRAMAALGGFEKVRLQHVPREENEAADALANAALDSALLR